MKPTKQTTNNLANNQQKPVICLENQKLNSKKLESEEKPTLGQHLADKLANKVGSWAFLIGQTAVLSGWVGMNLTPGIPHWDESPFILLNLVFSFASAYTAPIVLMSQNRQSDIDRKKNDDDHLINKKAGQDIELLHGKIDDMCQIRSLSAELNDSTELSQQLAQLKKIVIEQQKSLQEMKIIVTPSLQQNINSRPLKVNTLLIAQQPQVNSPSSKVAVSPTILQQQSIKELKVNGKQYSVYLPLQLNKLIYLRFFKSYRGALAMLIFKLSVTHLIQISESLGY
jgi:uncharacterized membrane protein